MRPRLGYTILVAVLAATHAVGQATVKQITFGDYRDLDPVVSPNGDYLAVSSNRTGSYDLYLYTFSNEGVTQLTRGKRGEGKSNIFRMKAPQDSGFYGICGACADQ